MYPKLPIKESPRLYRVIAHMIGDGSAAKRKVPYYANTCKELREQFTRNIGLFGKTKIYEQKLGEVPIVIFPKVIADVLAFIFKVRFSHPNKIPEEIKESTEECKKAFLQALFDDEGCISTNLYIGMSNLILVQEVKELVGSLGLKTGKISIGKSSSGRKCYYFSISKKHYRLFKKEIGFQHPRKLKRLEVALKIQNRNKVQRTRPLEWTRTRILNLLKERPRTTLELSEELLLEMNGVHFHLKFLESNSRIKREGYKNRAMWCLA